MGVLQRFERKLEGAVGNAFARLFKGKVHPAEIARALQRDAEENKVVVGAGRVLVPNTYVVMLSTADYDHLSEWERQITASLADMVREHLIAEGWSTYGQIKVKFEQAPNARIGIFEVQSSVDGANESRPPYGDGRQQLPGAGAGGGFGPGPVATQAARDLDPGPPTEAWAPVPPSTPAAPRPQHYIVVDGPNTKIHLQTGNNIVGRGSDARIKISDTGISRQHADVVINGQGAVVQDLRSTNGTQVNGRRITSATLRHGDVIRVGHSVLVYRFEPQGTGDRE